ncbi:methionine/alanine import family NSS transporter small subunit [Bacillus sp. FJAT-50079]|nr:methionine/alanine import family NSS transporter small subunit [Bacillus sp. FJAT-50079]MBS4208525.1 methionine/alanine import family NSS transporter small subunit [Bacillus sp. FJAT-50079]
MSGSAITMMIIGVLIIWGGLGASVALAILKAKESKRKG